MTIDFLGKSESSVRSYPSTSCPVKIISPIGYTKNLSCPILGIFVEDDKSPAPEQVAKHEKELKKHGRIYEFHMYPGAGHGFFYYNRTNYRQEQAVDGREKI